MSSEQAKRLAHELTIEYLRANSGYLKDVRKNIPQMVDQIVDVNKRFYDAIIHHETLSDLY